MAPGSRSERRRRLGFVGVSSGVGERVGRVVRSVLFPVAIVGFAGCAEQPPTPEPGGVAPDFELLDLEGNPHRLAEFAGRVVVLNFWATWCPPCVDEMPSLQELEDRLGADGLTVIAISVDERFSVIEPFVAEHRLEFLVLHDLGRRVSRRWEVFQFPETWIVGRDGALVSHVVGARDWSAPGSLEVFRDLLGRPARPAG